MEKSTKSGNTKFFLLRLANGEYGLYRTFWYFGFLFLVVFGALTYAAMSLAEDVFTIVLMLVYFIYSPFAIIGLIEAAKQYTGKASLAKFSMFLNSVWMLGFVLAVFIFISRL
jgi:hypothetical protein